MHKQYYSTLLKCNTLDEAKAIFPEFEKIVGQIQKNILTSWEFYEEDRDINKILELIENIQ